MSKKVRWPWLLPMQSWFLMEKEAAVGRPTFVETVGKPEMHRPLMVSMSLIAFGFHFEHSTSKLPREFPYKEVTWVTRFYISAYCLSPWDALLRRTIPSLLPIATVSSWVHNLVFPRQSLLLSTSFQVLVSH